MDIVRETYLAHHAGNTVNPGSYFLRFPEKPEARIIALPAFVAGEQLAGIKWISSFPGNTTRGFPRASAVLVLNDCETGYPVALLEAAGISAARTAASAALAAQALRQEGFSGSTVAFVGAGVIARTVCDYLLESGCRPDRFLIHDIDEASQRALIKYVSGNSQAIGSDLIGALKADTIVFATTAATPYVTTPFGAGQVVINVSLRDISPEVLLAADNILDDVEHCLNANTSPHLAEQASGSRAFITGTIAPLLARTFTGTPGRPVIFSPFGLGVLDVAVGSFVLREARLAGSAQAVPNFFGAVRRW